MLDPEIRIKRELLISAANELTAQLQLNASSASRPSKGQFSFNLNNANVRVEYCSEAARIDLNVAQAPLLTSLFQSIGASQGQAEMYSNAIVRWRTAAGKQE